MYHSKVHCKKTYDRNHIKVIAGIRIINLGIYDKAYILNQEIKCVVKYEWNRRTGYDTFSLTLYQSRKKSHC